MTADFEMYSGDDFNVNATVNEDIAGASIKWALKKRVSSAETIAYKTTGDGITITNSSAGEFTIRLDAIDTEGLYGEFYHEAELTDATGFKSTVLVGTAKLIRTGV